MGTTHEEAAPEHLPGIGRVSQQYHTSIRQAAREGSDRAAALGVVHGPALLPTIACAGRDCVSHLTSCRAWSGDDGDDVVCCIGSRRWFYSRLRGVHAHEGVARQERSVNVVS